MKIQDFVTVTKTVITCEYIPDAVGPWISGIKKPHGYTGFKTGPGDCMLGSGTGWGKTPDESIRNLVENIRKNKYKLLIVDDSTSPRQEFGIPDLEY